MKLYESFSSKYTTYKNLGEQLNVMRGKFEERHRPISYDPSLFLKNPNLEQKFDNSSAARSPNNSFFIKNAKSSSSEDPSSSSISNKRMNLSMIEKKNPFHSTIKTNKAPEKPSKVMNSSFQNVHNSIIFDSNDEFSKFNNIFNVDNKLSTFYSPYYDSDNIKKKNMEISQSLQFLDTDKIIQNLEEKYVLNPIHPNNINNQNNLVQQPDSIFQKPKQNLDFSQELIFTNPNVAESIVIDSSPQNQTESFPIPQMNNSTVILNFNEKGEFNGNQLDVTDYDRQTKMNYPSLKSVLGYKQNELTTDQGGSYDFRKDTVMSNKEKPVFSRATNLMPFNTVSESKKVDIEDLLKNTSLFESTSTNSKNKTPGKEADPFSYFY
jgi:hypothetical protein